MKMIQDIIVKPVISEASMDMMEQENGCKKYVFKVMKNATKPEIAKAVEEMFGVKVADVNTINMKSQILFHLCLPILNAKVIISPQ